MYFHADTYTKHGEYVSRSVEIRDVTVTSSDLNNSNLGERKRSIQASGNDSLKKAEVSSLGREI